MGKLLRFPPIRRSPKATEAACWWLVSLDEGLSGSERQRLEDWLAADPSHGEVLVAMAQQWDEQSILSELSEVVPFEHSTATRAHTPRYRLAAAALTVFATIGMSLVLLAPFFSQNAGIEESVTGASLSHVGEGNYRTTVGERRIIRLIDGSAIALNTNTFLEVDYSPKVRMIRLHRGEASFEVAHDIERPFEVHVGQHVFRALGTVFNVRLGVQNDVELMVNEGRVAVMSSEESGLRESESPLLAPVTAELGASEMAILKDGDAIVRGLEETEIEAKLAWKRGMLIFRGEPLQDVIEDVSRYTTIQLVIADPSIKDIRVGGYFRTDDIEGLLLALEESFGVMPTRVDDGLVILRKR